MLLLLLPPIPGKWVEGFLLMVGVCTDVAKNMDQSYKEIEKELDEKLGTFGWNSRVADQQSVPDWLRNQDMRLPNMPMMNLRKRSQTVSQPHREESIIRPNSTFT
jgi:hypothetical protein